MRTRNVAIIILAAVVVAGTAAGLAVENGGDPSAPGMGAALMYGERTYGGIETGNGSPLLGDPSAPVTIVEFGDYQCHFCEIWHKNTLPLIKENYIMTGAANLVFVDYAFLGRDSPRAAEASYCAEDQGMYWEYHDILYDSQRPAIDGGWASGENLRKFAASAGLEMSEFDSCMSSDTHANRIAFNTDVGGGAGVSATPTFFVIGQGQEPVMIQGAQPYGTFVRVLDSAS